MCTCTVQGISTYRKLFRTFATNILHDLAVFVRLFIVSTHIFVHSLALILRFLVQNVQPMRFCHFLKDNFV